MHAQSETIHPFTDGNGRVGRALINTVLARRGMVRVAVLPVSLVMLTRSDSYVEGSARRAGPLGEQTAEATSLQPHHVQAFLLAAFKALGGSAFAP